MARNKVLSSETLKLLKVHSCSEKWRLFHARNCQETEDLVQRCVLLPSQTAQTGSNENRKRSGRPRCTTEQEDKYIRVSSLRNRCLTNLLAASLNSTHKTPVSMSTVKRRLRGAGLLGRFAKKKPYLRLANKNKRLRWAKEHRHWTEEPFWACNRTQKCWCSTYSTSLKKARLSFL